MNNIVAFAGAGASVLIGTLILIKTTTKTKMATVSEAAKKELNQLARNSFGSIIIDLSGNKRPAFWDEFMKMPCIGCKSTNVDNGTMHYACLCGRRCSNCFYNDCSGCNLPRFQFIRA